MVSSTSPSLADYRVAGYCPGAGRLKRAAWYVLNAIFFDSWLCPFYPLKNLILRLFGARIGIGVIIKPRVNIKHPWRLSVGDHVWIGEGVWIDNLVQVTIGSNVCISQGAMLLTGNHDYKDPHFGLITGEITIGDGVWVGAQSIVGPSVRCYENAVITAGSILTSEAEQNAIYRGNPAVRIRERILRSHP
ncbi:MAG: colanic acid biosynthesis acetyltransferase WcaF [Gammaproteobacteria bacterium]|nr:colanic acid biosynthesis acetyltransferase WcaF [Gammaproteobacteria bacterium]